MDTDKNFKFIRSLGTALNPFIKSNMGQVPSRADTLTVIKLLEQREKYNLTNYNVWGPEGMTGDMLKTVSLLNGMLTTLSTLPVILRPLELWASHMLSDDSYGEKIWMELTPAALDVGTLRAELKSIYTQGSEDHTQVRILKLYPQFRHFTRVTELLTHTAVQKAEVLGGKDLERVESITQLVNTVVSDNRLTASIGKASRSNQDALSAALRNAAELLEVRSVVIFLVTLCTQSHIRNLDKIRKDLG